MNKKILSDIDVVVCYHKASKLFISDAIHPMQLNKKLAKIDLGFRGDDTEDNISERNRFYSEDTALYWLWKNSRAKIKGCLHYRRLLDLKKIGGKNYSIVLEDIKNTDEFINKVGLNARTISSLLEKNDIIIRNKTDIREFFDGTIEEQFKAAHISYHWDLAMEIVKKDFPKIYPIAKQVSEGYTNYFHNAFIMKSELFDGLCNFCFHVTETVSKKIDENRLEFNDNWRYTARYLSFIFERLSGIYITYLQTKGYKIQEVPAISLAPKDNPDIENIKNYDENAYVLKNNTQPVTPIFSKNDVSIVMSTDDNYVPCCATIIESIIEHANPARNYEINVLTRKISSYNKKLLEEMHKENLKIRVIDISNYLEKYNASSLKVGSHFSLDAYSRIFIPEIFLQYKKVLYLDVDMIVLKDIAKLYDTDIGKNWWGVVQDKFFVTECHSNSASEMKKEIRDYLKNTLKMNNIADVFNSGVMIWNIERCKEDFVLERCLSKILEIKSPKFVDQCILNAVANGKNIYWLSPYWNVSWNVAIHWNDGYGSESYNTALHYLENPFILHFTGCIKPWNEPWRERSEFFWNYARKTPFYEKLTSKIVFNVFYYLKSQDQKVSQFVDPKAIKKLKRKIRKYRCLKLITFGTVKKFSKKYKDYKIKLKNLCN